MHGIQRLPAVLFNNHALTLKDINLENYEILKNEPLHDVSNQIKNLSEEMPNHVPKDMRSSYKQIITASYNGKEAKKGAQNNTNYFQVAQLTQKRSKLHLTKLRFTQILPLTIILKT